METGGHIAVPLWTEKTLHDRIIILYVAERALIRKKLVSMSLCHAAYFCKGWENARGCRIEHETAEVYGLDIIYEE